MCDSSGAMNNHCMGASLLRPHEYDHVADGSRMGPRQSIADIIDLMGRPAMLLPSDAADMPDVTSFAHVGGRNP